MFKMSQSTTSEGEKGVLARLAASAIHGGTAGVIATYIGYPFE